MQHLHTQGDNVSYVLLPQSIFSNFNVTDTLYLVPGKEGIEGGVRRGEEGKGQVFQPWCQIRALLRMVQLTRHP